MIDKELIKAIHHSLTNLNSISELNDKDVKSLTTRVANKYICDTSKKWWWESLRPDSFAIEYGEEDGLKILENLISKNLSVFLVVTDDESEPWNVFKGEFGEILEVLVDQRLFEYFIVPEKIEWIVFDTHHNSLVVAGTLNKKAKKHN